MRKIFIDLWFQGYQSNSTSSFEDFINQRLTNSQHILRVAIRSCVWNHWISRQQTTHAPDESGTENLNKSLKIDVIHNLTMPFNQRIHVFCLQNMCYGCVFSIFTSPADYFLCFFCLVPVTLTINKTQHDFFWKGGM